MIRILCLLLAVSFASVASADKLYKWTDEHGKVHYTDQPPPEGAPFEKREIKTPPPAASAPAATAPPAAAKPTPACEQAKRNLDVFEKSQSVQMDTDGDGKPENLEGAQRERELQRTRDLIKTLCTN